MFHYVIQKKGCAEILHWSQERTLEDANRAAEEHIARFIALGESA